MCSPYVNFFEPQLEFIQHLWFTVNVSVVERTPSLHHLLSNHLWPRGCSMVAVVHLCLISPVYSYSSEIIVWCFQGRALTRHRLHQQATGHAESIRERCLCDFNVYWKEEVVKRRVWFRWRWDWRGSVSYARGSRTHTLRYKHTRAAHVWRNFTSESDSVTPHHRVCDLSWNTLCLLRHTHYMQTYAQLLCHHICLLHTHTSLCSSMKQLSNEACCHSDDRIIRSCKWTKASWHTLTQKHTNTDSVMY